MKGLAWVLVGVMAMIASPAAGDPRSYPGDATGLGCIVEIGDCTVMECPATDASSGAVCFPAGHIPSSSGTAVLTITDAAFLNVGAFYCQDLDDDHFCGSGGEPGESFCASVTLIAFANWFPGDDVYVYIPDVSAAHTLACDPPTIGAVNHTP